MAKGQRITGTDSSDFLRGTGFNDWIFGRGGDDVMHRLRRPRELVRD